MIACFAWTNSQIINIVNAKLNLYPDEGGDLFIRMGGHISVELINAIKKEEVFDNVFCMDPLNLNYNKLPFGKVKFIRGLFARRATKKAYDALLDKLCFGKKYNRVVTSWFYTENAFFVDYWARNSDSLPITFIDEGTGSYCLEKKDMYHPLSLLSGMKAKLKSMWLEGKLIRKYSRNVDSIALYRPEACRESVDYQKLKLPTMDPETNPVMYNILCSAIQLESTHVMRYNKRDTIFFSTYSTEGKSFDLQSISFLQTAINTCSPSKVIAKIHTGNTSHATHFAESMQNKIFVDRERYIFEGLYAQLEDMEGKIMISCMSSAAINPKFMFNKEPIVIFVYRLYDGYRQNGVERDDWMAEKLMEAYTDKSRIMIPNSRFELQEMLDNAVRRVRYGEE